MSTFTVRNPAHPDEIVDTFPEATAAAVAAAVAAAAAAFPAWAATPAPARVSLLAAWLEGIKQEREALAALMTAEMGKPLGEARGEVAKAIAESAYMLGEGYRLTGETAPSERPGIWAQTHRVPVGVVAAITPWNFPVLTPLRKVMPALVCGCTVVLKPSELSPGCADQLVALARAAGLPPGVLNIVHGTGSTAGAALVEAPGVKAITFTGSTRVGTEIYTAAARRLARVQLELGGKNPAVVWDPADLGAAARAIAGAAFLCTGQRCTAISRVIVRADLAPELEEALRQVVSAIRVGPGTDPQAQMGPLVNAAQLEKTVAAVAAAQQAGARLLTGGHRITAGACAGGYFYAPTLLAGVTPDMAVAREEVFGPVLPILRVRALDEAIALCNDTPYGLTAAIFCRSLKDAMTFVDQVQSGMVHVNHGTTPESHMPFGGVKSSGVGPYNVGSTAKDFFTDTKVVYLGA